MVPCVLCRLLARLPAEVEGQNHRSPHPSHAPASLPPLPGLSPPVHRQEVLPASRKLTEELEGTVLTGSKWVHWGLEKDGNWMGF